jgi:hypothetical protein
MSAVVPYTNRHSSPDASGEAALYLPVKAFLERQGYVVRGEVRGCDLVACRGNEEPVIVELKLRFTLSLLLQGVDRLALSPLVYLAVPRPTARTRGVRPDTKPARKLCRRLGLGLMVITGRGTVEVIEDPLPYRPRQSKRRSTLLLGEFDRRRGDLNVGGSNRIPIVTAYRQDALRCVRALAASGTLRLDELRVVSGVAAAAPILQRNVYGWFDRVSLALTDLRPPASKRWIGSPRPSPCSTGIRKRLPTDGRCHPLLALARRDQRTTSCSDWLNRSRPREWFRF